MMKRVECIVRGRVQGVFYRATARQWAQEAGVAGTVRNLPDGTVEVIAEGEEEKLAHFLEGLAQGSPFSKVDGIAVEWKEPANEFFDFRVLHKSSWRDFW